VREVTAKNRLPKLSYTLTSLAMISAPANWQPTPLQRIIQ
jgi:hypothetical protein